MGIKYIEQLLSDYASDFRIVYMIWRSSFTCVVPVHVCRHRSCPCLWLVKCLTSPTPSLYIVWLFSKLYGVGALGHNFRSI